MRTFGYKLKKKNNLVKDEKRRVEKKEQHKKKNRNKFHTTHIFKYKKEKKNK